MSFNNSSFNALSSWTGASTASRWRTPVLLGAAGMAAAFLYVQACKARVEREHPPAGKFVEVDGVRLHYLEQGEGPALVLLHGNGVTAQDFVLSGLFDAASASYRVIAFDRPGFGYSERPGGAVWTPEQQARLIYQALHILRVERPIVVGHSWGTLVALAMALDYPRYVRGLALVGGYYYPSPRVDAAIGAMPAIPVLGHLWRYTFAPLLGRLMWPLMAKKMFAPAAVPARFDALPPWMALRPGQLGASAGETGLMVPSAARIAARYDELTLPITLLAGAGDRIVDPQANTVRLHEAISHSELRMEPGAGHMAHYAAPGDVLEAVKQIDAQLQGMPAPIAQEAMARLEGAGGTLH
ncbi:MAG: alpha/beta fold hydrolase [Massilia sp.]